MELDHTISLINGMAGDGDDPYSNQRIAYRLELTRIALGYKKKSQFIAKVPGLKSDLWFNYTGSDNTPPRDRIPHDMAVAICRAFPDVTLDWIYLGNKETLRRRFADDLDEAERALQTPSKPRRKPKNR